MLSVIYIATPRCSGFCCFKHTSFKISVVLSTPAPVIVEVYLFLNFIAPIYINTSIGFNNFLGARHNPSIPTIEELRSNLKAELQRLHDTHSNAPVSPKIIASKAYEELRRRIDSEETMSDSDALWAALESAVLKVSPRFKKNLILLTGARLSRIDYHTALLIKCGCKPAEIATLLRRGKSSIVSRRKVLASKAFNEFLPTDSIDAMLRVL